MSGLGFPQARPLGLGGGGDTGPAEWILPDGPIFRVKRTGHPWRYRGVSAFKLCDRFRQGGGSAIDAFLAAYPGFNVLRVWDYVGDGWGDQAWDAASPDVWVAFLSYVGMRGWWVERTLLTDDDPKRIEAAKEQVRALRGWGIYNLLLEAGNEPTTHKAINTGALRDVLAASGFPYTSGDYEDSLRWYGTYYTCHTARTFDWCRRSHDLLEFFTGAGPDRPHPPERVPCIGDEPGKWGDVGTDRREWRAYFGGCSIMGGGATFHSESGKFAEVPNGIEQGCRDWALEGLNAFPASAPLAIPTYHRIVEPDQAATARTYVVGDCAVRSQQEGTAFPEPGWTSLDPDGVLLGPGVIR